MGMAMGETAGPRKTEVCFKFVNASRRRWGGRLDGSVRSSRESSRAFSNVSCPHVTANFSKAAMTSPSSPSAATPIPCPNTYTRSKDTYCLIKDGKGTLDYLPVSLKFALTAEHRGWVQILQNHLAWVQIPVSLPWRNNLTSVFSTIKWG